MGEKQFTTLEDEPFAKPLVRVVATAIVQDGKVLCAQRSNSMSFALLWEFPGGKIELGESPVQALEREIAEELNCKIEVGQLVGVTVYEYENFWVDLQLYFAKIVAGFPQPVEHAQLKWCTPTELSQLAWVPADLPLIENLRTALASYI